jgi:glycolate oxidase iron-sulfur subunit
VKAPPTNRIGVSTTGAELRDGTRRVAGACALDADTPLARARPGLDACVHCGFCLQACPTYLALEDENDSPRGRLVLMRALVDGSLALSDSTVQLHIDRCLGCRACETACPSGVPYGELLEATRATLAAGHPIPWVARAILWIFAGPARLAAVLAAARVLRATRLAAVLGQLPGRVGFSLAMLAATRAPAITRSRRPYRPEGDGHRGGVAILRGCVMAGLFPGTNRATARTLIVNDYRIVTARGQRCCGALHAHAGDLATARRLARVNIAAFERADADAIAVNAAGCGAMIKSYGHLLADDPAWANRAAAVAAKARDVSELLAAAGPAPGASIGVALGGHRRVAYDPPCHLLHAQRVGEAPFAVLAAVPGIELVPLADAEQCCGAAGIYNLIQPAVSDQVLAAKLAHIAGADVDWVVTGNPGCLMQIGAGLRRGGRHTRAIHPVDLLDAAYAVADRAESGASAAGRAGP